MKQFERPTCAKHLPLRNAILRQITEDDECPLDDLLELEEHYNGSVIAEVITLVNDGLAYARIISWSLSRTPGMYVVATAGASARRRRAAEAILRSEVAMISSTGGTVVAGMESRNRALRTRWSHPRRSTRPAAPRLRRAAVSC